MTLSARTLYWAGIMAVAWTLLQGNLTLANFVGGFLVGLAILVVLQPYEGAPRFIRWAMLPTLRLGLVFLRELILANMAVVREILSRDPLRHRAILVIPLEPDTDLEIATLANLVTLTPGTLSLEVTTDRSCLIIHSLMGGGERREATVAGVKEFEHLIREAIV